MKNDILFSLRLLSDAAVVASLKSSLARERSETATIVAHLADLDTRDVCLREGYPSLFVYCRDALGMSEGEAYNRIESPALRAGFLSYSRCWRTAECT